MVLFRLSSSGSSVALCSAIFLLAAGCMGTSPEDRKNTVGASAPNGSVEQEDPSPKKLSDRALSEVPLSRLDRWLAEREQRVPSLVPGTRRKIHWADAAGTRTSRSIVYVHGFSATRQEVAPTIRRVAATLGANVYYTRLTGHGRNGAALAEASLADWQADVRRAWRIGRRIGDSVILVGTSTGAALAAWLSSTLAGHMAVPKRRSEAAGRPAALVLLSPNFGLARGSAELLLWPGGRLFARLVVGEYRSFAPENALHARYWTERYPSTALVTMMRVVELGRDAPLRRITAPTLMLYTDADEVISVPDAKAAFGRLGAPRKQMVEVGAADRHVLAGRILSPDATDAVVEHITTFLRRSLAPEEPPGAEHSGERDAMSKRGPSPDAR